MTGPTPFNRQLTLGEPDEPETRTLAALLTASRHLGRAPGEEDRLIRELVKLRNMDSGWQAGRPEEAVTILMHGGCPTGGDRIADAVWWGAWGMPTSVFLPDWDTCDGHDPLCGTDHRTLRHPRDVVHPHTLWAEENAWGADPWGEVNAPWPTLTPGTNRTYCPGAGPRRNLRMIAAGPDWCLALTHPDSKGSTGTAKEAKRRGVPTHVIAL